LVSHIKGRIYIEDTEGNMWIPEGEDCMEDLGVGKMIILEWILREIGWKVVDCLYLFQDRDHW
jgi:hypothetical protein